MNCFLRASLFNSMKADAIILITKHGVKLTLRVTSIQLRNGKCCFLKNPCHLLQKERILNLAYHPTGKR